MKTFREYLKDQFKKDRSLERDFFRGIEKDRIAVELNYYREKAGITQSQLAQSVGTSQSAIARLESPDYKGYSLRMLRKIAEALDLELVITLRERNKHVYEKETRTLYVVHPSLFVWGKKDGYRFVEHNYAETARKEMVI